MSLRTHNLPGLHLCSAATVSLAGHTPPPPIGGASATLAFFLPACSPLCLSGFFHGWFLLIIPESVHMPPHWGDLPRPPTPKPAPAAFTLPVLFPPFLKGVYVSLLRPLRMGVAAGGSALEAGLLHALLPSASAPRSVLGT